MTVFVLIKLYSRSHRQTKNEMKGRQRCKNMILKWSFKLLVVAKQPSPRWYSPLATTTIPSDFLREESQPVEHILQRCTDALILMEALLPTYTRTRTYGSKTQSFFETNYLFWHVHPSLTPPPTTVRYGLYY